jgi:hypothetical protein
VSFHDDLHAVWRARLRFAPALALNAPTLRAIWAIDRLLDRLHGSGPRTGGFAPIQSVQ